MNVIEKLYYDLTGTPYFKVELMSHNHIIDVLSFKPSEKIITDFGLFKEPKDENKVYVDNKYRITYDVTDFKPLTLKNKPGNDNVKDSLEFNDIKIDYIENDKKEIEACVYIADKISPKEFMAMNESESIIAVSKPQKNSANNLFTTQNMLIAIGLIVGLFIAYKYMTTGRLF